jgi:transposase InsO family protein
VQTTDSKHDHPIAPNVLERAFDAKAPNEVWVGGVTYIATAEGWLYLPVLLDLFSRRVVGWATSDTNDRALAIAALEQALQNRRPSPGLVRHTDRGSPGFYNPTRRHSHLDYVSPIEFELRSQWPPSRHSSTVHRFGG